jgi:alpha-glucosidase
MDREPFAYGEPFTTVNRLSIERRYRLLPYLYTLAEEAHRKGVPLARPLFWTAPDDVQTLTIEDQFLLGDGLLVAPVVEPGVEEREVYFPAGVWYAFDPNDVQHAPPIVGPRRARVAAPLGKLPMFARAGTLVPTEPVRQHTSQMPSEVLTIDAFAGLGNLTLYEDAGEGHGHRHREFARTYFEVTTRGDRAVLSAGAREGEWAPRRRVVARLHTPLGITEATYEDDGTAREILSSPLGATPHGNRP